MRENKFKIWCKDFNEWEKDECVLTQNGTILHKVNNRLIAIRPENHIPVFFTGLKDKNGKEIYEGDILKMEVKVRVDVDELEDRIINTVISWGSYCYVRSDYIPIDAIKARSSEVIGNIYENPGLIK